MNQSTRRGFIALTGSGVAAVAVAPAALAHSGKADAESSKGAPMVAHVRDAATGEIALMVGEREVVVHDRALVATMSRHLRA